MVKEFTRCLMTMENHVVQAWSRAALAWLIVVAGAKAGELTPPRASAEAASGRTRSTLVCAAAPDAARACRGSSAVQAAHHAGADDLLLARHRRPVKRFRRRLALPASRVVLRSELLATGAPGTVDGATLDPQAPDRDHARAPPPPTRHA